MKNNSGVCIVELLVVIAIMSVLLSLIVPAYASVKQTSQKITCTGNLKNLGAAFYIYSNYFSGYIPHEDNGDTQPPFNSGWYEVLDPYISKSECEHVKQCTAASFKKGWKTIKINSLLEDAKRPFYRFGSSKNESDTILLFDGRVDNQGVRNSPKGTWDSAATRHTGITNLLFLDGHTQGFASTCDDAGWTNAGPFDWYGY